MVQGNNWCRCQHIVIFGVAQPPRHTNHVDHTPLMARLSNLPSEIFVKILAHLDYKQVLQTRAVSDLP